MKTGNALPICAKFFLGMGLLASLLGCQQEVAENGENTKGKSAPEARTEEADAKAKDDGYLQRANELFEKAKAAGQTTASNTGEWISDQVSGAMEATGTAAQDTGGWVSDTFESLKSNGMTTASNTSEWVQQDMRNMYSFEYKVLPIDSEKAEEQLNELGEQRWECFAVSDNVFYFKRQRKSYLRNVPVKDLLKFLPMGIGAGE